MGKSKELAAEIAERQERHERSFEEAAAEAQAAFTRTENGDNIHSALLTIQLRLKAPKQMRNDFAKFNYRTAGQILEAVKPVLAATGCTLTVDDEVVLIGSRYYVHAKATLHHIATGAEVVNNGWARESEAEKGKMDSQLTGSASTYAKKYALSNLFSIDDSSEDPDGRSGQEPSIEVTTADFINEAIKAFNTAQSIDECKSIQAYYKDVMQAEEVRTAAIIAKNRLTNN